MSACVKRFFFYYPTLTPPSHPVPQSGVVTDKMGVVQKDSKPAYSPIPDDQSATESDDLLYESFKSSHAKKSP